MMNKRIIAGNISNLTDARYFAAQGVEFLLFDLSVVDIVTIAEIKEWISGPEIMLILGADQVDLLDEAIIKLAPKAIGMDDGDNQPLDYLSGHIDMLLYTVHSDHIEVDYDNTLFTTKTDEGLADVQRGLLLMGGDEEQVGMKSYDDLNEVFDRLYDL